MKEYDFVVIGGGATSTAIMAQIAKIKTDKPFSVLFIEKSNTFGPGFPYSENTVLPDHIVNTAAARLDITKTNISGDGDFMKWAGKLPTKTLKSYGLSEIIGNEAKFFSPRYVVGKYLADRFDKYKKQATAKANKITVTLLHNTEAIKIEKNEQGQAIISLSNGKKVTTVTSANVMLATGYWQTSRFKDAKGYFESPWPASRLLQKVPAENVAIIGSNLGAIDAALTLSTKFGKFSRSSEGKLIFTKNPNAERFGMTMYSNSGQLPEVTGYISPDKFVYKHVTTGNIEKLRSGNDDFLPLDGFFNLFRDELKAQAPKIKHLIPDIDTIKLEDFFRFIDENFGSKDQIDKLRADIARAQKSLDTNTPIALQHVIFKSYSIFSEISQFFSAEDLNRYKHIMHTLHKIVVPFPIRNAEKMLALLESGCLHTVALGHGGEEKLSPDGDGLDIIRPDHEMLSHRFHHNIVIDALGQSGNIEKDPSLLYTSLLTSGLTRPVLVKFADQAKAAKLFTDQAKVIRPLETQHIARDKEFFINQAKVNVANKELFKDFPEGSIKEENGIYYYKAPGILVDMSKFKVISPDNSNPLPNIYTVGPNTSGQAAILQDLGTIVGCAEIIINEVTNNLGLCPNVSRLHRSQRSSESIAASQSGGNILNYLRSLARKKYAKEHPEHNVTSTKELKKEYPNGEANDAPHKPRARRYHPPGKGSLIKLLNSLTTSTQTPEQHKRERT